MAVLELVKLFFRKRKVGEKFSSRQYEMKKKFGNKRSSLYFILATTASVVFSLSAGILVIRSPVSIFSTPSLHKEELSV